MKPILLDMYCGAGGAAMGYHMAGFEVVGVDIAPQPRFPFEFYQADALEFLLDHMLEFDAYHASPPCQGYSETARIRKDKKHPDLIGQTRQLLRSAYLPYVIENVRNAPLENPIMLNGAMFGLLIKKDRYFECSFPVPFTLMMQNPQPVKMGRPVKEGQVIQTVGNFSNVPYARRQMGIDWMYQKELAQAIPPAYTRYIGKYLLEFIQSLPENRK